MNGTSTHDALHGTLRSWQRKAIAVAGIGVACSGVAAILDLQQFLHFYLIGFLFWWSVTMGCLGLLMLYYLVGGRWGAAVQPLVECAALTSPLIALLFLPVAASLERLYPWTGAGVVSAQKALYLNPAFFCGRAAGYFLAWSALAWLLRRRASDTSVNRPRWRQLLSAGGLVVLVLTVTFAAIDWAMSLDPAWYSSIYGALMAVGGALAGMALVTMMAAALQWSQRNGALIFPEQTLGDLGTLLLAFLMLWAYFGFSQFLIIWSGNLPEDNFWYVDRLRGGWQWLALSVVVLQLAVAFFMLLSREGKQSPSKLAGIATLIFIMQYVYLLWTVSPSLHPRQFFVDWADIVVPVAIGGVWVSLFLWLVQRSVPQLVSVNQR